METRRYQLTFLTPAFLGDANQDARWRTPPIKHLLREWWRVAWVATHGANVDRMRDEEGRLFGTAFGETGNQSRVRLRLVDIRQSASNAWTRGTQQGVAPLPDSLATSYAWFGLVKRGRGEPDRNALRANEAEGTRELRLAFPREHRQIMTQTLELIDAFGLVGSRSRGGWGSVRLHGDGLANLQDAAPYCRDLPECLRHDWASAIGRDDRGAMIWEGKLEAKEWDKAMRRIAGLRRDVRSALKQEQGRDLRRALGFASPGRMASPLRWKVTAGDGDHLTVRVFATPHRIPECTENTLPGDALQAAWLATAQALDSQTFLQRS